MSHSKTGQSVSALLDCEVWRSKNNNRIWLFSERWKQGITF